MPDQILQALQSTQRQISGVIGLQVAGTDGRSEAHTLEPASVNATAAVSASSLQLARRLADLLGDGDLQEITVRSSDGYVIVYAISDMWVLTVLTVSSANVARIHLACRDLRTTLASMLDPSSAAS